MLGLKLNHVSKRGHWEENTVDTILAFIKCQDYVRTIVWSLEVSVWSFQLKETRLSDGYDILLIKKLSKVSWFTGIILDMDSANERLCYNVTASLIGWAHIQNDPFLNRVYPIKH